MASRQPLPPDQNSYFYFLFRRRTITSSTVSALLPRYQNCFLAPAYLNNMLSEVILLNRLIVYGIDNTKISRNRSLVRSHSMKTQIYGKRMVFMVKLKPLLFFQKQRGTILVIFYNIIIRYHTQRFPLAYFIIELQTQYKSNVMQMQRVFFHTLIISVNLSKKLDLITCVLYSRAKYMISVISYYVITIARQNAMPNTGYKIETCRRVYKPKQGRDYYNIYKYY